MSPCPDLKSAGDGRLAYRLPSGRLVKVLDDGTQLPTRTVADQYTYNRPQDPFQTSGRYAVARVHAQDATSYQPRIQVIDLGSGQAVYTAPADAGNRSFALDGSTLWVESGDKGTVNATDVRTGTTVGTVNVSDCDITALQANGSNLLWECGSSASGVYDTAAKRNVALPVHQSARLGDGYVAWQQNGVLSVTVRGTSVTRALGRPKQAEPGKGWTVDRFGGPAACTDTLHIAPTGIPASALNAIDTDAPARANANSGVWAPRWWLSKPAASWALTLADKNTGTVVRTLSGRQSRGLVAPTRDGEDKDGRDVPRSPLHLDVDRRAGRRPGRLFHGSRASPSTAPTATVQPPGGGSTRRSAPQVRPPRTCTAARRSSSSRSAPLPGQTPSSCPRGPRRAAQRSCIQVVHAVDSGKGALGAGTGRRNKDGQRGKIQSGLRSHAGSSSRPFTTRPVIAAGSTCSAEHRGQCGCRADAPQRRSFRSPRAAPARGRVRSPAGRADSTRGAAVRRPQCLAQQRSSPRRRHARGHGDPARRRLLRRPRSQ
ncbi:hypothetical protein GCM10010289_59280 [Streptomyces violascens]|nr:hypothetical protein GCM10010289_59280 [Streptomyces violascens]